MKRVIWTNGVFDILHPGHVELLRIARSLGDYLVVGLDHDERVQQLKGPNRPINSWKYRKEMLESIRYVDHVVGFNNDDEIRALLELFKPHLVVDNSNWTPERTPYMPSGIEVRKFGLLGEHSTTGIVEKIRNRYRS